jgi:hypothetical protein
MPVGTAVLQRLPSEGELADEGGDLQTVLHAGQSRAVAQEPELEVQAEDGFAEEGSEGEGEGVRLVEGSLQAAGARGQGFRLRKRDPACLAEEITLDPRD